MAGPCPRGAPLPRAWWRPAAAWTALLGAVAALLAVLPALPLAPRGALLLSSSLQAGTAALSALVVLRRRGLDPRSRRAWTSAGTAVALWAAAQSLLTADRAWGDGVRPLLVDVLFIGAAAGAVAAALTVPTRPRLRAARRRSWLDAGIVAASVLLLSWLRVGPALTDGLDTVRGLLGLAYPVVDSLVVALLVDSVVRAPRRQARALGCAASGLVVLAATNLESYRLGLLGPPPEGASPLAAGFAVGLGLVATGALLHRPGTADAEDVLPGPVQRALPFAVVPVVLVLLLLRPDALGRPGAALLAGLAVLLLARQLSSLEENAQLARELVARARRHEALASGATDVTLLLDPTGVVRYASPSVRRVLGREPDALVGAPLSDLLEPDDASAARAALAAAEGGSATVLLRLPRAGGGGPLLLEARLTDLRHDPETGGLALNGHDVTGRREAERALEESERRFRQIVETAQEGIWVDDATGAARYVNSEVGRLLGVDPAELLGRTPLQALEGHLDDEARRHLLDQIERRREGRSGRYTLPVRRADGRRLHVQVAASPLFDAEGGYDGSLTMLVDVTERVELEERLSQDARRDALTGLPNRLALLEAVALAVAREEGPRPSLVYCDLDTFKGVNDTWGHDAGDDVLREVAARLTACLAPGQLLARLGGDEFAVLLPDGPGEDADALVSRLLTATATPVPAAGRLHHVGMSVGLAHAGPGDDAGALLRNADLAMYAAKGEGGGRVRQYAPAMHAAVRERRDLEDGLWEAVERGQLTLHYQPVVELATGRCVGAEALLRWTHPELGTVPPEVFVAVAEETGAVVPIGRWVLRTACAEAASWPAEAGPLTLSVNIAPRQLLEPGLTEEVEQALREAGLPADRLLLEVTERSLLAGDQTRRTLGALRGSGVRLALDDFGTGWSSISHLRDHPVDVLKLDRSYVGGMTDSARTARLVHAVLDLSRHLGTASTAEGVETLAQAEALRAQGCRYAQGWLFSPPLPAAEFRAWLSAAGRPLPAPRPAQDDVLVVRR